jgi:hypothetical protein
MKMRDIIRIVENLLPNWLTEPLYHGTARNDLTFHPKRVAYFAADFPSARRHALLDAEVDAGTPHVICVRLKSPRPAKIDGILMQDLHMYPAEVAKLMAQGHDCAIGIGFAYDGEVAVFPNAKMDIDQIALIDDQKDQPTPK